MIGGYPVERQKLTPMESLAWCLGLVAIDEVIPDPEKRARFVEVHGQNREAALGNAVLELGQ